MPQFIFTFGIGDHYWNRYAVIDAPDSDIAREKMIEIFGKNWAFQYTEQEFSKSKSEGFFLNLESLPTVFCEGEKVNGNA